jgi:hypothetical protein
MAGYLAYAGTSALAGVSISAVSSMASLIQNVRTLSNNDKVKEHIGDLDIEATVTTIELVCKSHMTGGEDFLLARDYVIKALHRVKFDLETIHVKTRLHHEGYVSRWTRINLRKERKKLVQAMKVLRSRFKLMWQLCPTTTQNGLLTT